MSKENKDQYIIFRVTKSEKEQLAKEAENKSKKLSEYIRKILWLDQ